MTVMNGTEKRELEGSVAVVTGAGQGIGRAIALRLAAAGAKVLVADINLDTAREVEREIAEAGGFARAWHVDVADPGSVDGMVAEAVNGLGGVNYLVNNAGITRDTLLMRLKPDDLELVLAVNLKSAFYTSRAAARWMVKAREGVIVNISSIIGLIGNAGQTVYGASKAGLIGLTKSLARELGARGIRVNAVAPGFIDTAMTRALPEEIRRDMLSRIPLARFGTADDVADAVEFLVSKRARYITGHVLVVDGGMVMR